MKYYKELPTKEMVEEDFRKTKELKSAKRCNICMVVIDHGKCCEDCLGSNIIKAKDKSPVSQIQDPDEFNDKIKAYWREQGQW